jgi:hypothetical protein
MLKATDMLVKGVAASEEVSSTPSGGNTPPDG